jgi:hypothetical protein
VAKPQVSVIKRQREQAKRERQAAKAARRAERKTDREPGAGPEIEDTVIAEEPLPPQ